MICEESQVDEVTIVIRKARRIGPNISGWVVCESN
jgi:nitrogen regulatory protein P-II 1